MTQMSKNVVLDLTGPFRLLPTTTSLLSFRSIYECPHAESMPRKRSFTEVLQSILYHASFLFLIRPFTPSASSTSLGLARLLLPSKASSTS